MRGWLSEHDHQAKLDKMTRGTKRFFMDMESRYSLLTYRLNPSFSSGTLKLIKQPNRLSANFK